MELDSGILLSICNFTSSKHIFFSNMTSFINLSIIFSSLKGNVSNSADVTQLHLHFILIILDYCSSILLNHLIFVVLANKAIFQTNHTQFQKSCTNMLNIKIFRCFWCNSKNTANKCFCTSKIQEIHLVMKFVCKWCLWWSSVASTNSR